MLSWCFETAQRKEHCAKVTIKTDGNYILYIKLSQNKEHNTVSDIQWQNLATVVIPY